MPNWGEISEKLKSPEEILFQLQRQYIELMKTYTGRNVIAYYSAFMQKPGISGTAIDDNDKNAFMQMVAGIPKIDRKKWLGYHSSYAWWGDCSNRITCLLFKRDIW